MTAVRDTVPTMRTRLSDFKDLGKRIIDPDARMRKLLADRECRVHGGPASEGHHLIWKGDLGDDVEANLIPLCTGCHTLYHTATGQDWRQVAVQIAARLTVAEIEYVEGKLGVRAGRAYLARRYHWHRALDPRIDPRRN